MVSHDNAHSRASFAGSEPDLSRDIPVNLRQLRELRTPFDHARDPLISAQLKEQEKTESQRREEGAQGSEMVRKTRLSPKLRPKHELEPIRDSFNRAWFKEQREARLAQFKDERESSHQQPEKSQEIEPSMQRFER